MRVYLCVQRGKDDTESKETGLLVWSKCGYCLWGVAVLVFYVIGIVQMATLVLLMTEMVVPLIFKQFNKYIKNFFQDFIYFSLKYFFIETFLNKKNG